MDEENFRQFILKNYLQWYNVSFPKPEFQEYLKIPAAGHLGELIEHIESLIDVIIKIGFQWDVMIDNENKIIKITDTKIKSDEMI